MITRSVATVFGGSGFIGRYLVGRLAQAGYVVRVVSRDPARANFLRSAGRLGQVVPMFASAAQPATLDRVIQGADVVVNLIGIVRERRRGDFTRINAELPGQIAQRAAASGVTHMVHVSGIGAERAHPAPAARAKAAGEQAVLAAMPNACILRPSVVFGEEDRFFNPIGRAIQLLPFAPVVLGRMHVQPVYVGDVADAIMAAIARPDAAGGLYELGGPRVWTMRDIVQWVNEATHRHKRLVPVPAALALGRQERLLLSRDNVVQSGAYRLAALGIAATPIELIVPGYIALYAPGGGRRDMPGEGQREAVQL
jgi:uncharacterized protein YbjT (DUF2867 family)